MTDELTATVNGNLVRVWYAIPDVDELTSENRELFRDKAVSGALKRLCTERWGKGYLEHHVDKDGSRYTWKTERNSPDD